MLTYQQYEEYRNAKGYTDYKVSSLTGIAPTTFSEWKHGKYTPKIDKMVRIAKVLEIPIEVVLG